MKDKDRLYKAYEHGKSVATYTMSSLPERYAPYTFDSWYELFIQDKANGVEKVQKPALPIRDVSQRSELFFAVLKWAKQAYFEYPDDMLLDDFEKFTAKHSG